VVRIPLLHVLSNQLKCHQRIYLSHVDAFVNEKFLNAKAQRQRRKDAKNAFEARQRFAPLRLCVSNSPARTNSSCKVIPTMLASMWRLHCWLGTFRMLS